MTTASPRRKARAGSAEILDVAAVIDLVKQARAAGKLKDVVSPGYVSDVVNLRRDPGPALLEALGLERVCGYRRAK